MLPAVYVIGDSISIHYGIYLQKYLDGQFHYSRKMSNPFNPDDPEGANGRDSGAVLEYLRWLFENSSFHPDILLVNCGLHDIKTDPAGQIQVPLENYRQNLTAVIDLLRSNGISWAWLRTTPVSDSIHNREQIEFRRFSADEERYNAQADELMKLHDVPVIDLKGFTRALGQDEELFCDHVHFRDPIREKQAAYLAGWLALWKESTGSSADRFESDKNEARPALQ